MRLIAIIGASGSGKSALAHRIAIEQNCEIFSLDSLSIYKYIDIASAKPTPLEQAQVRYHALNLLEPSQKSNAMLFKNLLLQTLTYLKENAPHTPLLIVGGSSFFLKSIIDGLSPMPPLQSYEKWVDSLGDLAAKYNVLCEIDSTYAHNIKPNDSYRICKALALFKATNMPPSVYFANHRKEPLGYDIEIFSLECERNELRERIAKRTKAMIQQGIVEEVQKVLGSYGTQVPALRAIGTKECVEFLQGKIPSLQKLQEQIFFHTCQLAKRQRTFNHTQFSHITHLQEYDLEKALIRLLQEN